MPPPSPPPSPPPAVLPTGGSPSPPPSPPPPAYSGTLCAAKDLMVNEVGGDSAAGRIDWVEIARSDTAKVTCSMAQCTFSLYACDAAADACAPMSVGYSASTYSLTIKPKKRAMLVMPTLDAYEKRSEGSTMMAKLCCDAGFTVDRRDKVDHGKCIAMSGIGAMGGRNSWGQPKDKANKASCAMRASKDKKNRNCLRERK
jgi:hypothetical protein